MILHIDSGAATLAGVQHELERLGYVLREPVGDGPVHRFARGSSDTETIDVMVADRLSPKQHPKALRRTVFADPGGTSALRKTVNCEVTAGEVAVVLSIPDVLGALVLKGAAYVADSRDRGGSPSPRGASGARERLKVEVGFRWSGTDLGPHVRRAPERPAPLSPHPVRGLWLVLCKSSTRVQATVHSQTCIGDHHVGTARTITLPALWCPLA
jgi:hypothetical protein